MALLKAIDKRAAAADRSAWYQAGTIAAAVYNNNPYRKSKTAKQARDFVPRAGGRRPPTREELKKKFGDRMGPTRSIRK